MKLRFTLKMRKKFVVAAAGAEAGESWRQEETGSREDLYAEPGAVFYDSDNNVVGFCYGLESFDAGQKKSFEISGDMMSEEYDPSIVDHVEVFMQGDAY